MLNQAAGLTPQAPPTVDLCRDGNGTGCKVSTTLQAGLAREVHVSSGTISGSARDPARPLLSWMVKALPAVQPVKQAVVRMSDSAFVGEAC